MTGNLASVPSNDRSSGQGAATVFRMVVTLLALSSAVAAIMFLIAPANQTAKPLTDEQIRGFLRDDADPDGIRHALAQVEERMVRRQSVAQFAPELAHLASNRAEDIQHRVAHVLGSEPSSPECHQALLTLLHSRSPLVRNTAALSLATFADAAGRESILAMLQPLRITAPQAGRVKTAMSSGSSIGDGELIAQLDTGGGKLAEVRSPVTGRIRRMEVQNGDEISAGVQLAVLEPGADQVLAALRALEKVGQAQDLNPVVGLRDNPQLPDPLRQQAKVTEDAIRARTGR